MRPSFQCVSFRRAAIIKRRTARVTPWSSHSHVPYACSCPALFINMLMHQAHLLPFLCSRLTCEHGSLSFPIRPPPPPAAAHTGLNPALLLLHDCLLLLASSHRGIFQRPPFHARTLTSLGKSCKERASFPILPTSPYEFLASIFIHAFSPTQRPELPRFSPNDGQSTVRSARLGEVTPKKQRTKYWCSHLLAHSQRLRFTSAINHCHIITVDYFSRNQSGPPTEAVAVK